MTEYTVRQINRAKALSRRMYKLPNGERIYLRFPKYQRIEHQTLILSFFTLSFSGLVQRYSNLKIANRSFLRFIPLDKAYTRLMI